MAEFSRERFREIPSSSLEQIYTNPSLQPALDDMGVNLQELGVFLDKEGDLKLKIVDFHHRTVGKKMDTPLHVKTRKSEEVFAHFDLKGVGFSSPGTHRMQKEGIERGSLADAPEVHVMSRSTETPWGYDVLGLFDERLAMVSAQWAEHLSHKGFRGEEFPAIYRLKHVWIRREQKTKEDFVAEQGRIFREQAEHSQDASERDRFERMARDMEQNFSPVLAVRCMRSIFRIRDLVDAPPELAKTMLREAVEDLKQESAILGEPVPDFDVDDPNGLAQYVKSIVEWVGHNLGILQKEGLAHAYLHMGNISLAGEVVDLDSIEKVVEIEDGKRVFGQTITDDWKKFDDVYMIPLVLQKDIRDAIVSCRNFIKAIKRLHYTVDTGDSLAEAFLSGWRQSMKKSRVYTQVGVSYGMLENAVKMMALKGIRDGRGLQRISFYPGRE